MVDQTPKLPSFRPGLYVWFGKFKNKSGVLKRVYVEHGVFKIEIEPVPKGRKKSRIRNLFSIRPMSPEDALKARATREQELRKKDVGATALKVAARFEADPLSHLVGRRQAPKIAFSVSAAEDLMEAAF